MGQGFRKFQTRVCRVAFLKAVLGALACGLPTFSILFVLSKREIIACPLMRAAAVSVAVALGVGALLLLFLIPGKKRLARRLDRELDLNEKVQTMLAFAHESGEMVEMQRRDTDARLMATPAARMRIGRLWVYAVALMLAVAMLISAVLVPEKPPLPPPPDPHYEMNDWQEVALENLIAYVRSSGMIASAKDYTVSRLEALLTALRAAEKESQMKALVLDTIVGVDAKVDEINSYPFIKQVLVLMEEENADRLVDALKLLEEDASVTAFKELRHLWTAEDLPTLTAGFAVRLAEALGTTGYGQDDALQAAMTRFSEQMTVLAGSAEGKNSDELSAARDLLLTDAAVAMHDALYQQSVNRKISNETIVELMEIFGIAPEELPDLNNEEKLQVGGNDHMDYDDDDYQITDGGLGSGELQLGGEDTVYDPITGSYVQYKDVIFGYYAAVSEKLMDGTLTDDEIESINDYFATLFNSNET